MNSSFPEVIQYNLFTQKIHSFEWIIHKRHNTPKAVVNRGLKTAALDDLNCVYHIKPILTTALRTSAWFSGSSWWACKHIGEELGWEGGEYEYPGITELSWSFC